ncbi:hypothetical protein DPMN_190155 [Dreissena polymorpha]|uniref:Uncharacterized protein n=1 Tax=Dreissena polymorpha TaxID=45954 RepID=A0A9D4DTN7_DREPO|nr:hypothetical protein DPMN_190155 [Dreissena polymorpha]
MQEFSNSMYKTSEQHKETTKARICRDSKDMETILSFFRDRNPFDSTETKLRNIESGVTADESANPECALAIGKKYIARNVWNTAKQIYLQTFAASSSNERKVLCKIR